MEHKPPLPSISKATARSFRNSMTDAENKLWFYLRGGRLNGCKFRRQHPIPPYVVDFYCGKARLVVELDGSQHNAERDAVRTRALERQGLKMLRFWDNQVLQETDEVLAVILGMAQERTLSPPPLPGGEGL